MKTVMMILALMLSMTASAQNAEKLYQEGKALYDAKDYSKAVPKLKTAAEKGHKKAQYRLGLCYDKGKGVAADETKARSWLKKAVKNEKDGDKILKKIKEDASDGDEDARKLLTLLK